MHAGSHASRPLRSRWNSAKPETIDRNHGTTQGLAMNESNGYAVFFFPQALEALGDAIKPYLQDGPMGPHVICHEIDTGGALLEMTIQGVTKDGKPVMLELMVPGSMVRMVVSSQSDASFGFGPRIPVPVTALPAVGPTAVPAQASPEAVPSNDGGESPASTPSTAAPSTAAPAAEEAAKPAP